MKLTYDLKLRDTPKAHRASLDDIIIRPRPDTRGRVFLPAKKDLDETQLMDAEITKLYKLLEGKTFIRIMINGAEKILNVSEIQIIGNFRLEPDEEP
jgi:hypothetical protein